MVHQSSVGRPPGRGITLERSKLFGPDQQREAHRKLLLLDAAENLNDLRIPSGNRLEKLNGNRKGQHSIRINQQWRICFRWNDAGAETCRSSPPTDRGVQ